MCTLNAFESRTMRRTLSFIERFFDKFIDDETTTLAASLAFYTALSLAPLLILFVTIAAQLSPGLQISFQEQVRALVGNDAAMAVEMVINSAKERPDLSSVASLLGVATLLLSASLIFGEMRAALNRIFGCALKAKENLTFAGQILKFGKERIFHIGLALSFIFILIVSLIGLRTLAQILFTLELDEPLRKFARSGRVYWRNSIRPSSSLLTWIQLKPLRRNEKKLTTEFTNKKSFLRRSHPLRSGCARG
jgi:membrane protein